ncbi:MAG: tRNA preQ1(34) S-adenosylmethionine ribosyltransferase-isomerase QueA [bacterium]|nr:tRNA preQ1(34) S-adenosylmethionine ribosyltransferase-isomerase QueA [bacterium]
MKLKEFDFPLPDSHIARFPSEKRDESRLMMVNRETGTITHHRFKDIPDLTGGHDFFVVNNSKVIPVKLFGEIDGRRVELLIVNVRDRDSGEVEAYTLPAKKFKPGRTVLFDGFSAQVMSIGHRGKRVLRFNRPMETVLNTGYAPLPPYIKRKYDDARAHRQLDLERYQTVYSRAPGSIAAPTAGLHFTPQVIQTLKQQSAIVEITLNVGEATFSKIEVEDIREHKMGIETVSITHEDRETIRQLKETKQLIAVGTTSVRSLETYALLQPPGESFVSELFISPGFSFRMVDKLITNFHLPQSSLFILVSAFAGLDLMQKAYRIAIAEGYRFFSYGDAMFIV